MNRISIPIFINKAPYSVLHDKESDLHQFKAFGYLVYASTLSNHIKKLEPKARKAIFLSYKACLKGSVLHNLDTKEIFISIHTYFYEHIIPYQPTQHPSTKNWTIYQPSHIRQTNTLTMLDTPPN